MAGLKLLNMRISTIVLSDWFLIGWEFGTNFEGDPPAIATPYPHPNDIYMVSEIMALLLLCAV